MFLKQKKELTQTQKTSQFTYKFGRIEKTHTERHFLYMAVLQPVELQRKARVHVVS